MTFRRTAEENRRLARGRAVASIVGGLVLAAKGLYDLKAGGEHPMAMIGAGLVFIVIGYLVKRSGAEPT